MCGVKPGDRVGLFLDRSPLVIAGMLGTHWAGAAYVPLDPAYPPARNRQVLEDAEVSAVLTRTSLENKVPSGFRHTLAIDDLAARRTLSRESPPVTGADLPAYILYTSGSTGRPKGVVVTHGNLRASTAARVQVYGAPPKRFLLLPSIAFDSSVAGIFWTLAEGGALVIPSDDEVRDPERLARLVAKEKVTSLLCVPSLYAYMLEGGAEELQTLETVIVAGESCRPQLVKEHFRTLPEARLFNEYGPTEATVWATVHEIRPSDKEKQVPIGRPIPGVRVEVLDAMGRYVPAGIPGEGWISGPTVAQGYWGRQGLADDRFISGSREDGSEARKYRSGDRMTWTADGKLLFLGRIDEQVKLRGFRIEPGEIESVLHEHPQVEEAAVVVRAPEHLVAFAVTSEPIADWRDQLTNRLPDFMVPSRLVELPELPRLPNSKVDRRRLREMDLDPEKRTDAASQVLGDREQALVSIWESLLGRTGIGIGDNFFELGGHSLLVVAMTSAIERELGVRLAPADIFQSPTIGEITKRIEHQEDSASPSYAHLFPIEPQGHRNPFIFCVPHFFSEMVANRFRGERPVYGLRGVSLRPEGNRGRWRTMTDLGEELVQEICGRFPNETLIIAGYSFGATMAVETVRLLEERGVPVDYLYLIAPMPIDFYRFGPLSLQIDGLRQPIEDLSIGEALRALANTNHPLTLRPYRRAWRQLAIQPWRRLLCLAGKLRILAGLPLTPRILHADVRVERFRLHAGYRPGHVSTPTVIFNAREPQTDAAATWRPYFIGPFTVHQIPDPHLDESSIAAAKKQILHHLRDLGTE
jgi:amino acid adenylation domain-containing protein